MTKGFIPYLRAHSFIHSLFSHSYSSTRFSMVGTTRSDKGYNSG